MEILRVHRASTTTKNGQHHSSIVFGSWTDSQQLQLDEEEKQGMECSHCGISSASAHKQANLIANHVKQVSSTSPIEKQQKRQIIAMLQHWLAPHQPMNARATTKSQKFALGKLGTWSHRGARSVASTAAESLDVSSASGAPWKGHAGTPASGILPETIIVVVHANGKVNSTWTDFEVSENIPLIQRRLFQTGIIQSMDDCEFVVDRVSKEVAANFTDEESHAEMEHTTHVKTGIWQVTCFDQHGKSQPSFFVVTGVAMEDRVDTKKLRKALFAGQTHKRRPKLSLAPTKIAEELAGYRSGTMAPICHSVDMKLYLDESIIPSTADPSIHTLNMGSGMFGKCLSIPADKFLKIAKLNPKGFEICSIVKR